MMAIIPCFKEMPLNETFQGIVFDQGWGKTFFLHPESITNYEKTLEEIALTYREMESFERLYRNPNRQKQKKISKQMVKWLALQCMTPYEKHVLKRRTSLEILYKEDGPQKGKPYLAYLGQEIETISIAHSHHYYFVAFGKRCDIGVDVEKLIETEETHFQQMVFSKAEWDFIKNTKTHMTMAQKRTLIWCLKEAIIKALGIGFSLGYQSIELMIDNDIKGMIIKVHHPLLEGRLKETKMALCYYIDQQYSQGLCLLEKHKGGL